jgi:hypothetical protein
MTGGKPGDTLLSVSVVSALLGEAQSKDLLAPIAAVCGAAIAAFAAFFNARKTPSDRLQTLIGIYKEWPDNVSGKEHLAALIRGQLGEMWHRLPHLGGEPETKTVSAEIDRAGRRHLYVDAAAFIVSSGAVAVSACLTWPIDQAQDVEIIVASLIGGFALFVAVTRGARIVRHWL